MGSWFVLRPEPHFLVSKISKILRPHLFVGAWQRSSIRWFRPLREIFIGTCEGGFALLVHWGRSLRTTTSRSFNFARRWKIRPRRRFLLAPLDTSFVISGKSSYTGIWFRGFAFQDFRLDVLDGVYAVDYLLKLFFQMWGFASDLRQVIEISEQVIPRVLVYLIVVSAFNCEDLAFPRFQVWLSLRNQLLFDSMAIQAYRG